MDYQPTELHLTKLIESHNGMPFFTGPSRRLSVEDMQTSMAWLQEHISFILPGDNLDIDNILKLAEVEVRRNGINGLVIDPWNELDHQYQGESETQYISKALSKVRRFARKHNLHIFIVAHPTKLRKDDKGKYPVPTPYDISGCHDDKTEVLTNKGWVKHADVTVNHKVACFDPEKNKMGYHNPQIVHRYKYNGPMFRFKSPSYDALVTPNHRVYVKPAWRNCHKPINSGKGRPFKLSRDKWTVLNACDLNGNLEMPWATKFSDKKDIETILGYRADEFLMFIGWWVAEGWLAKISKGLGICQGVGPLAEHMVATMTTLGFHFTESVGKPGTGGTINGWKAYLGVRKNRELCGWVPDHCGVGAANKKLPLLVWGLSIRQKQLLLDSLIEGDGSVCREDTFKYHTTSKQLADDVQRLSIECGRMAVKNGSEPKNKKHAYKYEIQIGRLTREHISLRKSRNITTESYNGDVFCLTVPTGAYLVRRNGKPGIYGNSAHWYNKADNAISCWRDIQSTTVDVHVQKVRFQKQVGTPGMVSFNYNVITGRYEQNTFKSLDNKTAPWAGYDN